MARADIQYDDQYFDDAEAQRRREEEARRTVDTTKFPGQPNSRNTGIAGPAPAPQQSVTQVWTRQNVSETLKRYGAPTQANLIKAVQENPWLGRVVGNGRIQDTQSGGTGRTWDVIGNIADKTGATTHWQTLTGNTARAKAEKAAKAAAKPAPAPKQQVVAPVVTAPAGPTQAELELKQKQEQDALLRQQLIDQLMGRAKQGLNIDPNTDPVIRAQADAYSANEERARRNYLADIAEEAGPLANLRGEERLAAERVGQRSGAFEAELVGRELVAKRMEIAESLEALRGIMSLDQQLNLQKELALYDDAIKRLQIKTQDAQFNASLAQNESQFGRNLSFQNKELSTRNAQFNKGLGFQYDQFDWETSPLNPKNYK